MHLSYPVMDFHDDIWALPRVHWLLDCIPLPTPRSAAGSPLLMQVMAASESVGTERPP